MEMLTGSSAWFSRDEVLRTMRKAHSIGRRIERREQHGGGDGGAAAEAED